MKYLIKSLIISLILISNRSYSQDKTICLFLDNFSDVKLDSVQVLIKDKIYFSNNNGELFIDSNKLPLTISVIDPRYYPKNIFIKNLELIKIKLINKGIILNDVTISSNLLSNKLKYATTSISVLDDIVFRKKENEFVINSLNQVTGLYSHSAGFNTNRITIRGMGSRSPYSTNKIKAYINNIPLSNGVGELLLEDFGINSIDQIQIFKGPNSSIYGSGLGGNIILSSGKSSDKTIRFSSSFKSFNTFENNFSFSNSNSKFHTFINIEKVKSDGYRENNLYENTRGILNFSYYINKNISLKLMQFYSKVSALIPSSLSLSTFIQNPEKAAFSWKNIKGGEDFSRSITGLSIETDNSKNLKTTSSLFFKKFQNDENRPFNFLTEDSNNYGMRHVGQFYHREQIISYGFEISYEKYHFDTWDNYFVNKILLTHQIQDRNNTNFFVQYDNYFYEKSNISLGLGINNISYNWVCCDKREINELNYKFKGIISPRLSYNYQLKKNSLFINISHGFSSPSIDETLDENGFVNPNIKPETGWNYEIGLIGSSLKNKISYNLNLYFMNIKNLLVAQRTSYDTFVGINAGETTHPGIEIKLNYIVYKKNFSSLIISNNFSKYWYRFKKFNHQDNDYSSNKLTGVPSQTLYSKIDFSYKKIISQLSLYSVGKIPINDSNDLFSNPYSIFNFKVSKTFNLNSIDIYLTTGINNLFNKKYASGIVINAVGFGNSEPRYFYPGLPRNFFITLTLEI